MSTIHVQLNHRHSNKYMRIANVYNCAFKLIWKVVNIYNWNSGPHQTSVWIRDHSSTITPMFGRLVFHIIHHFTKISYLSEILRSMKNFRYLFTYDCSGFGSGAMMGPTCMDRRGPHNSSYPPPALSWATPHCMQYRQLIAPNLNLIVQLIVLYN